VELVFEVDGLLKSSWKRMDWVCKPSYVLISSNIIIFFHILSYFVNPCRRRVFKDDLLPSLMMSWSPWEDWLNQTDDTYSLDVHLMARFGSPACEDSWP
jgi:hypothetical protein